MYGSIETVRFQKACFPHGFVLFRDKGYCTVQLQALESYIFSTTAFSFDSLKTIQGIC